MFQPFLYLLFPIKIIYFLGPSIIKKSLLSGKTTTNRGRGWMCERMNQPTKRMKWRKRIEEQQRISSVSHRTHTHMYTHYKHIASSSSRRRRWRWRRIFGKQQIFRYLLKKMKRKNK